MTAASQMRHIADPLAGFSLDALLEGAARLRPGSVALREAQGGRSLTFAALADGALRFAAKLAAAEFVPGDTMLLFAGPSAAQVVALLGGLRAGVNVALVPPNIQAGRLALLAGQTGASALLCGAHYGGIDLMQEGFSAAALSGDIRMVGALAAGGEDAADFSPTALANDPPPDLPVPPTPASLFTLPRRGDGMPVRHGQRMLVAAALDLITRARLSASLPLISTLSPASLAGLVTGPIAALLCGATLNLHELFDARGLLAQIGENPGAQLVVPCEMLPALDRGGLMRGGSLGGIAAVSRWQADGADFSPPATLDTLIALTDIHSFGEVALVPELRGSDGRARALLDPPHEIEIAGQTLLAIDATSDSDGAFRFFGAAVAEGRA